ncbi:hypothetical protein WH297_06030 [Ochrobactrum vermis]|uniref:Uncharacterized protein n=1 Tax=Ochrobactrum vermis TaxID=1827297 RepID=A0ABU8PAL6_9HYPH|nr:hypothetical protein [Ochrobactrum vermis]PQZ29788.1 hypothetical protein CQZ93_06160 [Ochrobactrum vermis]
MKEYMVTKIGKSDVAQDIVRLHKNERKGLSRHSVVLLTHSSMKKKYVVALGHDGDSDEIKMDFDLREYFDVDANKKAEFSLTDGGRWGRLAFLWNATSPSIYVPYRIALISFIMGAVGLLLGGISLCR